MKTTSKAIALAVLAALLCSCDSRTAAELKAERAGRLYQAAMSDYSAGRLNEAAKGFEKVVRAEPGNTSARFQLASLQLDGMRDYLGAFCNYREYLLIAPDSDKAKMAKERLALCERHVADELAKKHKLIGDAAIAAEGERARREIEQLKSDREKASASLSAAQEALAKLKGENERLRKLLATMEGGDGEPSKPVDVVASVKDLLDDDGDDGAKPMKVSVSDATGDDAKTPSAATALDDAKALNALAEAEEAGFGSSSGLLPGQAADAKDRKKAAAEEQKKAKAAQATAKAALPETYVVQDGDTLYKIAQKFYGRTSAWKRIREENKDKISTDGRVRTGQVLKLPK